MPSLSPSQSSTDQSSAITTTSSNNNSSSSNGKVSVSSSSTNNNDGTTKTTTTTSIKSTTTLDTNRIQVKKSSLKQPSSSSTVLHRKKLLQVVSYLDQQNQRLQRELQNEQIRRNEELSRIVKSLLYFEAKLKSEKKVINQKLFQKDEEIARLVKQNQMLVSKLKGDINAANNLNEQIECKYPEALYCLNCRKEFYGLNEKCDNSTQTSGKCIDSRNKGECSNGNNNQQNNSTEHCSSSDETLSSSFYGARRSVRYTSKRTFGTFREYMRSRCMNIDDPEFDNMESSDKRSTLSRDESPSQGYTNKSHKDKTFSSAMDRLHGVHRASSFEFDSSEAENRNKRNKYHRKHFSSSGPSETDHEHPNSLNGVDVNGSEDEEKIMNCDGKNSLLTTATPSTTRRTREFSETSVQHDFEVSTDDWYASASDADDDDQNSSSVCRTKSYGYNAVNPVLECVNQILLQQSMEECVNEKLVMMHGGGGSNSSNFSGCGENYYDNNTNGPISLDVSDHNKESHNSASGGGGGTSNTSNSSRKRVHFSTKNSMVHVPRDDDDIAEQKSCSFSDTIISEHHSNNLNYESIYSNEYEPIGSEHNSSNLYVDMESKLDQDERLISRLKTSNSHHHNQKQPPALPPKPANLIKFKRGTKISPTSSPPSPTSSSQQQMPIVACKLTKELLEKVADENDENKGEKFNSEPDYCSISEVNVAIKTMQIIADVHKSNDTNSVSSSNSISGDNSDAMSQKTSDETSEEILADIPKLPNVAAIIVPSSKNKSPAKNNANRQSPKTKSVFVQSPMITNLQLQQQQQRPQSLQLYRPKSPGQVRGKNVPNILAEINKKIQQANTISGVSGTLSPASPNKINSSFVLPISPTKCKQLLPILKSPSTPNNSTKNFKNVLTNKQISSPGGTMGLKKSINTQQKISSPITVAKESQITRAKSPLQTKIEDSLPLEEEFDWYNLDAEYGKASNRPDIIKAADVLNGCLDEYILTNGGGGCIRDRINQSVEYNLDEEFSLCNQPDIIKENLRASEDRKLETIPGSDPESNNSSPKKSNPDKEDSCDEGALLPTTSLSSSDSKLEIPVQDAVEDHPLINKNATVIVNTEEEILKLNNLPVCNGIKDPTPTALTLTAKFPTISDQTPCRQSVKLKEKNFIEFIDNAGLSTKSLPQQRKIYFTGPFV